MTQGFVFILIVISGAGFVVQEVGIEKKDKKILSFGLNLVTWPLVILSGYIFWISNFNPIGFVGLLIVIVNVYSLRIRFLRKGAFLKVKVIGSEEDLIKHFRKDIETESVCVEEKDTDTEAFLMAKVQVQKPAPFRIASEIMINISVPDKDIWRLSLITDFGVKDDDVFAFLSQLELWKDETKIHHHREFEKGKLFIHMFDSSPSNWNLTE